MGKVKSINFDFGSFIRVKESQYPQLIETDRLILQKNPGLDASCFYYFLNKKMDMIK